LALLFLSVAVLFPRSVRAQQDDITVTVPEVNPNVGQTLTVSVEADLGSDEVEGYTDMRFTFNDSAINIVDVRDGSDLSFGTQNFFDTENEGVLRVSNSADDPPVSGSGEFLQIDVELTVDGGTPLTLTPSDTEGDFPTSVFVKPDGSNLEITNINPGRVGELAQTQIIHNAADPNVGPVDVYFDGTLAVDDLSFRDATPFLEQFASGVEINLGVAPRSSEGPDDIIATQTATLVPGEAHTIVASGVRNPDDFADNPDEESIGLEFFVEPGADSTASSGEVDLRAVHGATDAPTVDIDEEGTTLLDDLTYGDVMPDYLSATPEAKRLVVTPGGSEMVVGSFDADLTGLGGSTATVLASGFLDPAANQEGEPFRLVAALPNGTVVIFEPADVIPIQQARQKGPDSTVTAEGTVTRALGAYVRFQDESGPTGASGLVIRQTADNPLANDFRDDISNGTISRGTTLRASGTLSEFRGLLQIDNAGLDSYSVQGQGSFPAPQVVSLSDVQAPDGEDYESELLRVENLFFPNRDTTDGTLDGGTTYVVEDLSGTTLDYRVQDTSETNVIGAPIPPSTFTYGGVLGQFTFSGNDEGYQFIPVRPSSGLPVEMAGFGAVRSGAGAELQWSTASETNNAGFRVEHDPAGQIGWRELGFVESTAAGGTSAQGQTYRFEVEKKLEPGTHRFRLRQVDIDGTTSSAGTVELEVQMNEVLTLSPPSPNPVSGQATVSFAVKEASDARVVMYNLLGQEVRILYEGTPQAGEAKTLTVETGDLPSGMYLLQIRAQGQTKSQRLTVVQ